MPLVRLMSVSKSAVCVCVYRGLSALLCPFLRGAIFVCVFMSVCKHVQYIHCFSFLFLGVCVVWEVYGGGFISEDLSVPCLQPRISLHLVSPLLFLSCYQPLTTQRARVRGWQDKSEGLCGTENCFCTGVWLAVCSSVFCSCTIGCLHICLAPIGQTKIKQERAVGLVKSPQVSIYLGYLFIYLSGYFYCALFYFVFMF